MLGNIELEVGMLLKLLGKIAGVRINMCVPI